MLNNNTGFDYNKYMASFGEQSPVSSSARARVREAGRYRLAEQKKMVQWMKEREFKEVYDSLLKLYGQYSGKEDDISQIMKAYYLELIQDLQDDRKRESTLTKWVSGQIRGVPARPHYIGGTENPIKYHQALQKAHQRIISSYK